MFCCESIGIIALRWSKFQSGHLEIVIELPVYKDNLRSSGDWLAGLGNIRDRWEVVRRDAAELQSFTNKRMALADPAVGVDRLSVGWHLVSAWAADPEAGLPEERLLELNRALGGGALRTDPASAINPAHDPPEGFMVERLLRNALDWFSTEGFFQMNPVEQATLVHLRLLELQPFTVANAATAGLAASFYLERAGLPPLIFDAQDPRYKAALESGFRMLTQHLVDFFTTALAKGISHEGARS